MRESIHESSHWTHTTGVCGVPAVASLDVVRVVAAANLQRNNAHWGRRAARHMAGCLVAFTRSWERWRPRWERRVPDAR